MMKHRYIIETGNCETIAEFKTEKERAEWTRKNCETKWTLHGEGCFLKSTGEQIFLVRRIERTPQ